MLGMEECLMLMPSIFGENLFDDFFDGFGRSSNGTKGYSVPSSSVMRTDVKEDSKGFELDIDLPGFKKEDVKAQLKDGYLTISAENSQTNDDKDSEGKYIRRERFFGTCSRSFYVGEDITEDDIKAKFENGILKISVPKKEAQPEVEKDRFISIEG
jgi:HSP20 family molecular chaperone IbpA